MKKIISITLAVTTTIWLSGVAMLAPVSAITIVEGDIVSPDAEYTDADGNAYYPYDVFIIKYVGAKKFKRLVLNPQVFDSYGHLEWANIKTATVAEVQAFTTSELTRADGDDKVYKLFPDGDVGTKRWVETLDCFTTNSYDWDSVYIINSTDRDNYTTGAGMCGGGDGDITLSLASDTPVAASIPYNAQSEPYLKVNVAGSGTISQMVFERVGVGKAADFENVYLYEGNTRLTSGRSVSSSTDKVTFIGLSVSAPTTLTVVVDLTTTDDNGHISAFKLGSASDVTSAATIGGTFPITGNSLSISSVKGGKLVADKSGSIANPTVGQKDAQVSQFKLTSSEEAINIERITLYNGGSMNSVELTNLKLKDIAGTTVATLDAFGSNDLAVFVFDTSYSISKGTTKIFKLYADVAGDKDDTIKIYFEVSADIKGIGDSYGHGVRADIDLFDATDTDEYHSLTLQGGELTIAFNGPIAGDIGEDTDDTVLLDLAFTAASNLEVRNLTAYVCWDRAADSETMANAQGEINDIKIKDKDTGVVLMGPTDGSSFTAVEDASLAVCAEATYEGEIYKNWTDTWDLDAGETKNIQITMDMKTSATADAYIDASDGFVGILRGLTNLTNPVKYRGTNDYVAAADIVPSSDITGNKMTIQASSIDVAVGSVPVGNVDGVKSQAGVTAMALLFTAGDASDMELTDLVLTAYASDASGNSTYIIGKTADGLYAKNIVNNVTLYEDDGTTLITNGGPKNLTGGTNDSDVTYDDLSWTIPAGATKKMLVKVDITTTATSSTYDYVAFDITDAADVTAIDSEGNSSNSTSEDINGTVANGGSVLVRKSDGGTLTVAAAVAGIRPEKTYVYQGQTSAAFSKFKFTSTIEAFKIKKMTVELDATGDEGNMTKVELEYPIDAAGTLISVSERPSGYFAGTASIAFDLTGKEMYVPKDDYAYVTVYADLSTYADLGDQSADTWSLDFEGDGTTTFEAIGVGSSKKIEADDSNIADADGQAMYLYRTFPSFTLDTLPTRLNPSFLPEKILAFTITNNGDDDLVFSSTSGTLQFDVLGSGDGTTNAEFGLYKSDGTLVASPAATTFGSGIASATFAFDDQDVTILANGSESFYVKIRSGSTVWDENGDRVQLKLLDETNVVKWDDGGDTTQVGLTTGIKEIGIPLEGPELGISGL